MSVRRSGIGEAVALAALQAVQGFRIITRRSSLATILSRDAGIVVARRPENSIVAARLPCFTKVMLADIHKIFDANRSGRSLHVLQQLLDVGHAVPQRRWLDA